MLLILLQEVRLIVKIRWTNILYSTEKYGDKFNIEGIFTIGFDKINTHKIDTSCVPTYYPDF